MMVVAATMVILATLIVTMMIMVAIGNGNDDGDDNENNNNGNIFVYGDYGGVVVMVLVVLGLYWYLVRMVNGKVVGRTP